MYSPNVAYKVGRRVARSIDDVWLTDEELKAAVDREIRPQVKPQNGQLQRAAAQGAGGAYAMLGTTLSLGIAALVLDRFRDATWMPETLGHFPTYVLWWLTLASGAITLLAAWAARSTKKHARAEWDALHHQLFASAMQGAHEVIADRRQRSNRAMAMGARLSAGNDAKHDPHWGLTPEGAEDLAALWMKSMGAREVAVTRFQGDGGIDVTSTKYIAQVKRFAGNVGVAPIRELAGLVRVDGRRGLFFTTTGYARGAIDFANQSGIALFVMDHRQAELIAINGIARAFRAHGLEA